VESYHFLTLSSCLIETICTEIGDKLTYDWLWHVITQACQPQLASYLEIYQMNLSGSILDKKILAIQTVRVGRPVNCFSVDGIVPVCIVCLHAQQCLPEHGLRESGWLCLSEGL
jgi:hypothetical protein